VRRLIHNWPFKKNMCAARATILLSACFVVLVLTQVSISRAAHAAQSERPKSHFACNSFHAIYTSSGVLESQHKLRLTVEKKIDSHPGYQEATLILDTLSPNGHLLLTRLRMPYACDGEGNYCQAVFRLPQSHSNSEKRRLTFPVIGLNEEFSKVRAVSNQKSTDQAPYALIVANLAAGLALVHWQTDDTNIHFFTPDRVPPQGGDVWLLTGCKP
jgi:hypothetical protein